MLSETSKYAYVSGRESYPQNGNFCKENKHDEHNGAISGKPMRGFPGALPKLVMFRKTAILSWDGKNCPTQSMMPYGHCVSVDVQIFDDLCGGQPSGQHLLS